MPSDTSPARGPPPHLHRASASARSYRARRRAAWPALRTTRHSTSETRSTSFNWRADEKSPSPVTQAEDPTMKKPFNRRDFMRVSALSLGAGALLQFVPFGKTAQAGVLRNLFHHRNGE